MTRSDDVDLDLLEQCRAGDRSAFRALIAFWAEPASKIAWPLAREADSARAAVTDSLVECWRKMPSMHADLPFRPMFLGLVARAAIAHATPGSARLDACLDALDDPGREAAILSAIAHLDNHEIALAQSTNRLVAMRRARKALKALRRCVGYDTRGSLLTAAAGAHADNKSVERLADEVEDHWLLEVRRIIARPAHDAWNVLTDPAAVPAWISAERAHVRGGGTLHPGAHIAARGRIADRRTSRDETVITIAEQPSLLAWTTRSQIVPWSGTIEFRWSIVIEQAPGGCELRHRLRGVAFPHGYSGRLLRRAYERVSDSMQTSMHHGLERLASVVEAAPG